MKMSEVLSGPETWVQGFAYLHESGRPPRYCLLGALARVTHGTPFVLTGGEIGRLKRLVPGHSIIGFNDAPGRTWDEIREVVERYDRDCLLNP